MPADHKAEVPVPAREEPAEPRAARYQMMVMAMVYGSAGLALVVYFLSANGPAETPREAGS